MGAYTVTLVGGDTKQVEGTDIPSALAASELTLDKVESIYRLSDSGRAKISALDEVTITKTSAVNLLSHEAATLAYDKLARDQGRFQRIFTIIMAVVGLVGFGSVAAIITAPIEDNVTKVVRDDVDKSVKSLDASLVATVDSAVTERIGVVSKQLDATTARLDATESLLSLQFLAEKLKSSKSVSHADRDEIMKMIKTVNGHEHIRTLPQFLLALETIVDSFAAADMEYELSEIDSDAQNLLVKSTSASGTMANHFGQLLIGSGDSPKTWSGRDLARFKAYMLALRDEQIPARHLPLEALVLYLRQDQNPKSVEVVTLLKESEAWAPEAQAVFHAQIAIYSHGQSWVRTLTPQVMRIEHHMRSLIRDYVDLLDAELQGSPELEEALVMIAASSESDADLQAAVASLRSGGYVGLLKNWGMTVDPASEDDKASDNEETEDEAPPAEEGGDAT